MRLFCQNCKKELIDNQKFCSYCGGEKRDIKIVIREKIKIRERLCGRKKNKNFKKFEVEFLQGWFSSKNEKEFPDGVQKTRIIDKKNNRYHEKVVNERAGVVVVNKNEKLSEHRKHKAKT